MCIPHAPISKSNTTYVEKRPKKHIEKVSREQFEKGDPDFVDERIRKSEPDEATMMEKIRSSITGSGGK